MTDIDLHTLRTKRCHFTLQQLAELSGIDKSTIHRLETGYIQNPSIDTVDALTPHLKLKRNERLVFGARAQALRETEVAL